MRNNRGHHGRQFRPTSRRRHIVRLAVFAAFLVVLFYLLAVKHVVNIEDVRRTVRRPARRRR